MNSSCSRMASPLLPSSATDVTLPGSYQAKATDSGVEHSQSKLDAASTRLAAKLQEIPSAAPFVIKTLPCQTEDETWSYRCRCSFQIIQNGHGYAYAMRQQGTPVGIGSSTFPIANRRIQNAMYVLVESILNGDDNDGNFVNIRNHLSSCAFSSAWYDVPEADCIVTLNYDRSLEDEVQWRKEAARACQIMQLRRLNGRSKGVCLSVSRNDEVPKLMADADDTDTNTIRDKVFLLPPREENDANTLWNVTLDPTTAASASSGITVRYSKPETTFYHPNGSAMTKALSWMLHRLTTILQHRKDTTTGVSSGCRLLEMYCGCGAHTVALAKTGMLAEVLAVELNPRLVEACKRNIQLNELQSLVIVQQSDAGQWAREESRRSRRQHMDQNGNIKSSDEGNQLFEILLVDPPRAGLDELVCQMALKAGNGNFQDFLYISCGHEALIRDLERLSPRYQVINCAQMDLFPRTDSIETLVHLRRREKPQCETT